MAITSGYFNSVNGDRKYNADQMSEYFEGIINEGVCQHIGGGLAVTAGTGLTVSVATGKAFIGQKWIKNDAALTLTITTAADQARIDAVVIRRNTTNRVCEIAVKTGTPSASPSAPAMTRTSTTYEMALAYVNVAAGATSVTVTDKRADTTVCGWATVAQATSGEVDAQLNALKTGFDGVSYESPAAMVQGCDEKIIDMFSKIENRIAVTETSGKFISTSGQITDGANFSISQAIPVNKNDKLSVYIRGYATAISLISKCDSSMSTISPLVISQETGFKFINYVVDFDGYIVLCWYRGQGDAMLRIEHDIAMDNITESGFRMPYIGSHDGLIHSNGTKIEGQANFAYSNPIPVEKGDTVYFEAQGYGENVAMISMCDSSGDNISVKVKSVDNDVHVYHYIVKNDGYIIMSWRTNATNKHILKIEADVRGKYFTEYIPKNILSAFDNITCCGDSLTYSEVYITSSSHKQARRTYPAILGDLTGATTGMIAYPGYSAKSWWEHFASDIVAKDNQLAIIYLGTNGGLTDTLATDAPVNTDYSTWADTYTGCYAKTVAKFQEVGAKIILVECYFGGNSDAHAVTTNSVIKQIADRFGCGYCHNEKLTNPIYSMYVDKSGYDTIHYNGLGYAAFTEMLIENIGNMDEAYMKYIIPPTVS